MYIYTRSISYLVQNTPAISLSKVSPVETVDKLITNLRQLPPRHREGVSNSERNKCLILNNIYLVQNTSSVRFCKISPVETVDELIPNLSELPPRDRERVGNSGAPQQLVGHCLGGNVVTPGGFRHHGPVEF